MKNHNKSRVKEMRSSLVTLLGQEMIDNEMEDNDCSRELSSVIKRLDVFIEIYCQE